jgi:NADPH-dependent glutamate synthase beta subunit-like oxidoreductase
MKNGKETMYQSIDSLMTSAPCQFICPIDTKVPTYVSLINRKMFKEAWDIIRLDNPIPSGCARVCHHPCQTQCQAGKWGGSVSIRVLKRVATDYAWEQGIYGPSGPKQTQTGEKIAVIGAGPAGLAAANDLADKGYQVTIFERLEAPGGAMAACIPEYRLPNEILNMDVENILHKGVELKLNTAVGVDISFEELRAQHKAVYAATGCHESKSLRIENEDAEGVLYSMQFLNDKNLMRNKIKVGRRVGIIGGGNAAMDAARTAKRQVECEEVTLIYRRTRKEMPAFDEEIEAALDEGVNMLPLNNPAGIVVENGKMVGVKCVKMELGEPDDSGRRRPVPIEGSEYVLDLDTLVIAIGENSDISYLGDGHGLDISKWNTIIADEKYGTTNVDGVFAGGDVVTGPKTVIEAIAAGKQAAISIDQYLNGKPVEQEYKLPNTTMYMRPERKLSWR